MWRKNDHVKQVIVSAITEIDFHDFDPSAWSILLYWNEKSTSQHEDDPDMPPIPAPPGLPPPDKPQPPYTPTDLPPDPPWPPSPPAPPVYGDPNTIIRMPVPGSPPSEPTIQPTDIPVPSEDLDIDDETMPIRQLSPRQVRERSRSRDEPREKQPDKPDKPVKPPRPPTPERRSRSPPQDKRAKAEQRQQEQQQPQPSSSSSSTSRPTAKKSMARPKPPKTEPTTSTSEPTPTATKFEIKKEELKEELKDELKEEVKDEPPAKGKGRPSKDDSSDDDVFYDLYTGTSSSSSSVPLGSIGPNPARGVLNSVYFGDATLQEDLYILEDDDTWKSHTLEHRMAAMTDSFCIPQDINGDLVDIDSLHTLPRVNTALYLDDTWHAFASEAEIRTDLGDVPESAISSALRAAVKKVKSPWDMAKKKQAAARREASALDKRQYAKQFTEAKNSEYKSWAKENDVYDLIDLRKQKCPNYVTGRWVLTVKRDKDGNFLKCKARWVLRGFLDKQVWHIQTDSPTSTRPGFRLQCQAAASNQWDLLHIDLKTAFLQGDTFSGQREVVCQLPPEAGLPPYMAARLKRAAYGLNDAPRLWWNKLDAKLRNYGFVPTRADRCCYVLYGKPASGGADLAIWEANNDSHSHSHHASSHAAVPTSWDKILNAFGEDSEKSLNGAYTEAIPRTGSSFATNVQSLKGSEATSISSVLDKAIDMLLDPVSGSPAKNKTVLGIITIHVDDLLITGGKAFRDNIVPRLRKDFQVGSEDLNDVLFVGQRCKWMKDHIQVDQERAVEELSEVQLDTGLRDDLPVTPQLHTQYRSVLGQINWLQSRTQYQACYAFSRCASASASPTIGDCRALNKLVRRIRAEKVTLRFWPLKGKLRLLCYPDAAYQNNVDKSTQRGLVIFLAEERQKNVVNAKGSVVDFESQKIKRTVQSTTVAELYAFMKCYGTAQFLRGLWMDISGQVVPIHMRTDANNLVTTASTTHLPEQKETIHMIQMLRTEACSGSIHDLAHVVSADCMADPLTKASAKADALLKAVDTGVIPCADTHPPFRELMAGRHKAFITWLTENISNIHDAKTFLCQPIGNSVQQFYAGTLV